MEETDRVGLLEKLGAAQQNQVSTSNLHFFC